MRTINADALAEIQKVYGLESILIVRVYWNDSIPYSYSDKAYPADNILGKILEISGLEDSLTLNGGSVSNNITVKLDDSDNTLKDIIDYNDIHKKRVQILQWFDGRPLSDAFLLFDGQINTPIEWSEGERTLTFTVVNLIENLELGFSFEDGRFPELPGNLVGATWPIVFGNVLKVPALQITESPTGILAEGFAIVYKSAYQEEINDLLLKAGQAYTIAVEYAQAATGASFIASKYIDGYSSGGLMPNPVDNIDTYNQYMGLYTQAMQQAFQYKAEWTNLLLEAQRVREDMEEKLDYDKRVVKIASKNFPRGKNMIAEMNNTRWNVRFDGVQMSIGSEIIPPDKLPPQVYLARITDTATSRRYESTRKQEKFKWFDGGTKIFIIDQPVYYVAALGNAQVNGVFARTKGITTRIPDDYYRREVRSFTNAEGNTVQATILIFNRPLSTLRDEKNEQIWESDDVWCDMTGPVAGAWNAIVNWSVSLFTDLAIDATSFNEVSNHTAGQPMNFVVLNRRNTLDFIKDLCFQARVSVWVNDRTLFFRYLPQQPTPVDSITLADIVEDTLIVTCQDTESLATKLTATWKFEHNQPEDNKVITRYNVEKYGVLEENYDYFAYNHIDLVRRSINFWAFRLGTNWKLIRFKTWMHKLNIEANDPVEIDGFNGLVTDVPVVGIVEQATYDSASNQIDMQVWLPVRWGEKVPYIFAYPADVTEIYGDQYQEWRTGNPFQDVDDNGFMVEAQAAMSIQMSKYDPNIYPISDVTEPTPADPGTTTTALTNVSVRYGRPNGIFNANDENSYDLKPGPVLSLPDTANGNANFGVVTEFVVDNEYMVTLMSGKVVQVKQGLIHVDYRVANGTPVVVIQLDGVYYMQAPIWANE